MEEARGKHVFALLDRKKAGKVPSFLDFTHIVTQFKGEQLGFGFSRHFGEWLFTRSGSMWPLPPAWPYFMSPSPCSPDLVTLVIFHQVHYLCTSWASLPCMARLNRRRHSCFFLRRAYSPPESKWGPLFITFCRAQKSTFFLKLWALLTICDFTYTCVLLAY